LARFLLQMKTNWVRGGGGGVESGMIFLCVGVHRGNLSLIRKKWLFSDEYREWIFEDIPSPGTCVWWEVSEKKKID